MKNLKRIKLKHRLFKELLSINKYDSAIKQCSTIVKESESIEEDKLCNQISEYCKKQICLGASQELLFDKIEDANEELFKMLDDNILGFILYEKMLLESKN